MGLTRSSSGLLLYDAFSSDSESDYTCDGTDVWSVDSGYMVHAGGAYSGLRRTFNTAKCATVRMKQTSTFSGYPMPATVGGSGAEGPIYYQANGYYAQAYGDESYVELRKRVDGSSSGIDSGWTSDRSLGTEYLWRLFIDSGTIRLHHGATTLAAFLSGTDNAFTQGQFSIWGHYYGVASWNWVDVRTSHEITCTGMSTGHYLRVSDGTTAAEAQESSGTATVDAGLVLFPLSSVQIRTASGGGGSLVAELGTGDYADMGGGDVYAYSAAAGGIPHFADLCGGLNNDLTGGI